MVGSFGDHQGPTPTPQCSWYKRSYHHHYASPSLYSKHVDNSSGSEQHVCQKSCAFARSGRPIAFPYLPSVLASERPCALFDDSTLPRAVLEIITSSYRQIHRDVSGVIEGSTQAFFSGCSLRVSRTVFFAATYILLNYRYSPAYIMNVIP
jgi:hypothetical protein